MVYHKILVALDTSIQASKVFQEALDIAQKYGSLLILFHCIHQNLEDDPIPFIGTIADIDMYSTFQKQHKERLQKDLEQAKSWLDQYCQQAHLRKVSTQVTQEFGEPGKKICNSAKSLNADLIVLGRRGHKGLTEVLLGSVSNYVVHHAACSVLIVQDA